jgi:hypothetical protein
MKTEKAASHGAAFFIGGTALFKAKSIAFLSKPKALKQNFAAAIK